MAINWKKHKFDIEELAEKGETNKLVSKLCENYALDIGGILEGLDKKSEDYSYYKSLQTALNNVQKQYNNTTIKNK